MRSKKDLVGQRFGKYLVVASVGVTKHRKQLVKCKLDSGGHRTVIAANLSRIKNAK